MKLLFICLLFLTASVFVNSIKAEAANTASPNCDSYAPGDNWGVHSYDGSGDRSGLIVRMEDTSHQPINGDYNLHALDGNGIVKWNGSSTGDGGKDNNHNTATGEYISNGNGNRYRCNGWSVYGHGDSSSIGNGFVINCGDAFGNKYHYQLTNLPTSVDGKPGYWEYFAPNVHISNLGIGTTGTPGTLSVDNGGTIKVRLVWHATPPHPVSGLSCTGFGAQDKNVYKGHRTYTQYSLFGTDYAGDPNHNGTYGATIGTGGAAGGNFTAVYGEVFMNLDRYYLPSSSWVYYQSEHYNGVGYWQNNTNGTSPPVGTSGTTGADIGSQECPQYFALQPYASMTSGGTNENPTSITYHGSVTNTNGYQGVNVTTCTTVTRVPFNGSPITLASRCIGREEPGETAILDGSQSVSGASAGDQYCTTTTASSGDGSVGRRGTITHATGDSSSSVSCFKVSNKPYFKVYNSSAAAGGDFASVNPACTGGGTLAGFNDNTGQDRGSGTQLSSLALLKITGVASAQTAAGRSPTDLTFANSDSGNITTGADSPSLGGYFGGHCLADVDKPQAGVSNIGNSTANVSSLSGANQRTGDLTLNGGVIATGTGPASNPSVFVTDGNVYISENGSNGITYSTANWTVNTDGTTNIPSFVLSVTGGNIYIAPNVKQLDGIYIAKLKNGRGGKIFTCADPASHFSPMPSAQIYDGCKNQLRVNGAFIAEKVNLMRTYGSLRDSYPGENLSGGNHGCSKSGGTTVSTICAGEVFYLSPELYLSKQGIDKPDHGAIHYDAITSLPPVL